MLFAGDFRQLFHVARFVAVNARSGKTYGAPEAHHCRYEPSSRLLRTASGNTEVSTAVLYTLAQVTVEDLVWLPGADPADQNASRTPIRVDTHYDLESGSISHYEVHV